MTIGDFLQKLPGTERKGRFRLKDLSFPLFLGMVIFVIFLSVQSSLDRVSFQRRESSLRRHQASHSMIARQAMEDHLRSIIDWLSVTAGTVVSDDPDGFAVLFRNNPDILSTSFRLRDRPEKVYCYHKDLPPGDIALSIGRTVLDYDHFVQVAPIRVEQLNLVDGHPLISVGIEMHSLKGGKVGDMVAVIDLLPGIERYIVPLQGRVTGHAYIIDSDGEMIYHPRKSVIGRNIRTFMSPAGGTDESWQEILMVPSGYGVHMERIDSASRPAKKIAVWDTIRVLNRSFRLVLSSPYSDIDESVKEERTMRFILGFFAVGTVAVLVFWKMDSIHQRDIRASKARYEAIVNNQHELVMLSKPNGDVTFANDAYCRFFGYDRRDIEGANLSEIRPADDVKMIRYLFSTLTPSSPINYNEEKVLQDDGTVRYLNWANQGLFGDFGLEEIQAVARDVTDTKKLEIALKEQVEDLEKLILITRKLEEACTKSELMESLIQLLTENMGFPMVSVTHVDSKGARVTCGGEWQGFCQPSTDEEAIAAAKIATAVEDGIHWSSIPIVYGDKATGAINIGTETALTPKVIRILTILSDVSAGLLELVMLMEKTTQEAMIDPLTNLWNRRFILRHLETEDSRIKRYGDRASIVLIDLGNFKSVNDLLGHEAGDEVLRKVAGTLSETVRSSDMVARYGGDEFLVYMPNTSPSQAEIVMARTARIMRTRDFPIPVFMDYGIAGLPEDGDDFMEIIKISDQRMYAAKTKRKRESPSQSRERS